MIPAGSFAALWDLSDAGIQVVAVTGRPAGWCDHIARMWPVAGVVGENGAFFYVYDRARRHEENLFRSGPARAARHQRLAEVAERVLREVPGTALAADQAFRLSDIAIDYREDVPPLPPERWTTSAASSARKACSSRSPASTSTSGWGASTR